ncbi:MAG: hypothetical protein R3E79_28270 [Caldilineaceae bacterium]
MARTTRVPLPAHGPALWLMGATVGYLALPLLIFCIGWLRAPWAITATLLLLAGLWGTFATFRSEAQMVGGMSAWFRTVTGRGVAVTVTICTLLVLLSGISGYGYQTGDWAKHEILLQDLVSYQWPVSYDYYGATVELVYYIAYYLPAAVIGKVGGVYLAMQTLALWTFIGLLLAVCWFALVTKRSLVLGLTFFVLFSGLSMVGFFLRFYTPFTLVGAQSDLNSSILETHPALWSAVWQYSPHVRGLIWVPQHVLPGWLSMGLLLFTLQTTATRSSLWFIWALTALWSPFITVGLVPFLVADLLPRKGTTFFVRLRAYLSLPNAIGLGLLLLLGLFFITKLAPITSTVDPELRMGTVFAEAARWGNPVRLTAFYLLFCCLEFGIYFLLDRYRSMENLLVMRWPYRLAFFWLAGLPLVVLGEHNDLTMRASIPALFFVAVMVGRNGFGVPHRGRIHQLLWRLVLLVAALSPLYEIGYQVVRTYQRGDFYELHLNPTRDLAEKYVLDPTTMQQYASRVDTFFFLHLAKPSHSPPAPAAAADLLFGESIILVDALVEQQTVQPGDTVELLLLLRTVQAMDRNYVVAVRLVDRQGKVWWEEQGWPAGAPTSTWPVARRLWYDHHTPTIPIAAAPGLYRLELYFADPESQAKLPVRQIVTGANLGEIVPLAYLQVGTEQAPPAYPLTDVPVFGNQIALAGSNLAPMVDLSAGATLPVTLTWQALTRPQKDYTGFVQLLDAQGRLVAQHDQPLTNNFIPATLWNPGLMMADEYQLHLPATLAPGAYRLIVGLYDGGTGVRLPIIVDRVATGDAVPLSEVIILK